VHKFCKNLKKFVKVALQNLLGNQYIYNIKQSAFDDGTIAGNVTSKNFKQIVNIPDFKEKEQYLLRKQILGNIEEEIKQSFALLAGRPINLLKKNRGNLVRRRHSLLMSQIKFVITPETKIIDIFNSHEIGHQLLITGEAGSGKTITIIELAETLINQAKQDQDKPIPVLFKLSYWKDSNTSFFDWLVAELENKYSIAVETGQKLIKERKIVPLVDEFDEVNPKLFNSCFEAINNFLDQMRIDFVICCRLTSYERSKCKLKLNGAICLQPLTEHQIKEYLKNIKNKNYNSFLNYINNNTIIKEISKNPLFFSLCVYAYPKIQTNPIEFKSINSLEKREQISDFLFNLYIEERIESQGEYKNSNKTIIEQLAWLARKMEENYMTEFCVEQLQPNLLEKNNGQQIIYRIGITLIFIVLFCFVFLQIGSGNYQLVIAIILGTFFGLTVGMRGGLSPTIEITESFIQKGIRYNKLGGLVVGFLGGILGTLVDWLYDGLVDGVTLALTGFLIGVLFGGIAIANSDIAEIGDKQIPNQGIKDSALNAMVFTLVYGFIGALIFGSICWAINGWDDAFDCAQLAGISFGLSAGMVNGGNTCIQHFMLRFVLYESGLISWNIDEFLEQSASLRFLQKIGGQYSFIHSELRNYFARKNWN